MTFIDTLLSYLSPDAPSYACDCRHSSREALALLPERLRGELPPLNATRDHADPFAMAKFFTPDGPWTWYATEYDGRDTLYGLVCGFGCELGYFSLRELVDAREAWGLSVERGASFVPTRLSALQWASGAEEAGPSRRLSRHVKAK